MWEVQVVVGDFPLPVRTSSQRAPLHSHRQERGWQGLGWGEVLAHGCTALGEADLAAVLQETRKDGEPASGSTMLSLGSGAWPHLNRAPASLA